MRRFSFDNYQTHFDMTLAISFGYCQIFRWFHPCDRQVKLNLAWLIRSFGRDFMFITRKNIEMLRMEFHPLSQHLYANHQIRRSVLDFLYFSHLLFKADTQSLGIHIWKASTFWVGKFAMLQTIRVTLCDCLTLSCSLKLLERWKFSDMRKFIDLLLLFVWTLLAIPMMHDTCFAFEIIFRRAESSLIITEMNTANL